ncbi:DUF2312 domain-containing protein [Devosia beringensis]|uniref:DUF2312 domain-containing protein n=1 Tax=Devosia beringensis TaxID=2657486 RepID=UPI00186B6EA4|nr:DUF2312 domain-containing protein [Devosia beringensis]
MAYPSNEVPSDGSSVAQDQIKAFVDRILRLKGEVHEINADIREIYAEAKGNGFDKTVLGKLVNYVEKRQTDAAAVMEGEAIFELYLTAYDGRVGTVHATHTHASEATGTAPETAKLLNTVADGIQTQAGRDALVAALDVMVEAEEQSEPQPVLQAGSDLAGSPANDDGQIADHNAQTSTGSDAPNVDSFDDATPSAELKVAGKSVGVSASAASAPLYAAPGVITWESTPPQGVIRHEYSQAFGEAGQDTDVIDDDMANAASGPIVKIGNVILDGWTRFMKARSLGIDYPVVQYDGCDPLIDCIKWNTAGRMLTEEQSFRIAQRLAKAEPKRKADIYAAFELGMVLA